MRGRMGGGREWGCEEMRQVCCAGWSGRSVLPKSQQAWQFIAAGASARVARWLCGEGAVHRSARWRMGSVAAGGQGNPRGRGPPAAVVQHAGAGRNSPHPVARPPIAHPARGGPPQTGARFALPRRPPVHWGSAASALLQRYRTRRGWASRSLPAALPACLPMHLTRERGATYAMRLRDEVIGAHAFPVGKRRGRPAHES